ncbi:putative thioredoxin reductase [Aspergillus campestris IBT 28561]|uniref:Thioredoxin reductase n=1 Tax=Aspergillus campestris (strain IBT 28561) TaxID=1392248 RepID=A0A2I1D1Z3_ASPC2|nr:putative thioredoxin reductase [Aspergillus campestris IBT 28561]PKY03903.1 putative thioredoxin reductase [Aspergillus campestris IBT 28561]
MAPKSVFYSLFASLSLALAAATPEPDFETIVVGGGPAGLSALSGLSRVRRSAALFDSHEYRNDPTRNMHDVIGNDGTVPSEFRGLARDQITTNYNETATFIDQKIKTIEPISIPKDGDATDTLFKATDATGKEYYAKKVVLATGMIDILPNTPGLEEAWGKGVYWCPWCDGFEHRDQPFGILGPLPDSLASVNEIWTLNKDIVVYLNGTQTPEAEAAIAKKNPDWRKQFDKYGVRVDNRVIASFERLQDGNANKDNHGRQFDIFRIHFVDGSHEDRNAFITNYPSAQRSDLPDRLGLAMIDGKIDAQSNPGMRTTLPGVFAIGDCNSDGSTNVPHAMFSGKRAAVFLHVELAKEEANHSISKRNLPSRRVMEREAERAMGNDLDEVWNKARGL